MVKFIHENSSMFLGVIRKYMQLRGGLSQKDLAEKANIGISTMSRFLNKKTKEYDPQMIASIVAFLNIPLHEIIDFIEENSTQTFKKLVSFYKESSRSEEPLEGTEKDSKSTSSENKTRQKLSATIKGVKVPFGENRSEAPENLSIRNKLNQLSPRQKGFLTDFLDLDVEGRDLIVDIGNNLFRYFKQGQTDF